MTTLNMQQGPTVTKSVSSTSLPELPPTCTCPGSLDTLPAAIYPRFSVSSPKLQIFQFCSLQCNFHWQSRLPTIFSGMDAPSAAHLGADIANAMTGNVTPMVHWFAQSAWNPSADRFQHFQHFRTKGRLEYCQTPHLGLPRNWRELSTAQLDQMSTAQHTPTLRNTGISVIGQKFHIFSTRLSVFFHPAIALIDTHSPGTLNLQGLPTPRRRQP